MPEDIRPAGTVLSRLELLEDKLNDTVLDFCGDREGKDLARNERVARTLAGLLRETERLEEMKKKYDEAGSDTDKSKRDPEEIKRLEERLLRKIDRIADTLPETGVDEDADGRGEGNA